MRTLALLLLATPTLAHPPTIDKVTAQKTGDSWQFSVTISHPDTGWDHYADGWRVLSEDGSELGMRVLHHPHVTEQPFTRSLGNVQIPAGANSVQIEARCSTTGWSGEFTTFTLP